ncbi:hypothetical protein PG996_004835 [Apiospora saccharicola]|uniref:Uncharacterized protein n=1 Tax=Apiospora saccharicola TaxID=335842 RepID=A0ABR1W828_9PEZI
MAAIVLFRGPFIAAAVPRLPFPGLCHPYHGSPVVHSTTLSTLTTPTASSAAGEADIIVPRNPQGVPPIPPVPMPEIPPPGAPIPPPGVPPPGIPSPDIPTITGPTANIPSPDAPPTNTITAPLAPTSTLSSLSISSSTPLLTAAAQVPPTLPPPPGSSASGLSAKVAAVWALACAAVFAGMWTL